jgi:hypothetical protein
MFGELSHYQVGNTYFYYIDRNVFNMSINEDDLSGAISLSNFSECFLTPENYRDLQINTIIE